MERRREEHKVRDEFSVEAEEGRIKRRKETINLYLRTGGKKLFLFHSVPPLCK